MSGEYRFRALRDARTDMPRGKNGHLWVARPLEERLRSRVEIDAESGCWIWQGSVTREGYGRIRPAMGQEAERAHRVSYETFVGPIPPGLVIDHLCATTRCINPDHLEPVTPNENSRRMHARNPRPRPTHCKHGHEFTPGNTYTWPRTGWRQCLTCIKDRQRARRIGATTLAAVVALLAIVPAASASWTRDRLWTPIHLDRHLTLDPDWVYRHFPTVSIGGLDEEQLEYDSKHRSVYLKLTRTAKANLPEQAYSHDASGHRIFDKVHHDLLVGNPATTAWRAYVRKQCAEAVNGLDADSCFGDGVGLASYPRMTAKPVTAGGATITKQMWFARVVGMLDYMKPLHVVANTAGWESPDVAAAAWARSVEGNPNTPHEYELTMLGSRAWILAYTNGPTRLARFLLYSGPEDRFAYWARDRERPVAWLRQYRLQIGQPIDKAQLRDGVVERQYATGIAVWNTTSQARSWDLGARYRDVNGNTARIVTLAAGAAKVYEAAP